MAVLRSFAAGLPPDDARTARMQFLLRFAYATGLWISEQAQVTIGDLQLQNLAADQRGRWKLSFAGKGPGPGGACARTGHRGAARLPGCARPGPRVRAPASGDAADRPRQDRRLGPQAVGGAVRCDLERVLSPGGRGAGRRGSSQHGTPGAGRRPLAAAHLRLARDCARRGARCGPAPARPRVAGNHLGLRACGGCADRAGTGSGGHVLTSAAGLRILSRIRRHA